MADYIGWGSGPWGETPWGEDSISVDVPLGGWGYGGWGDTAWGTGNAGVQATGAVGTVTVVTQVNVDVNVITDVHQLATE